MIEPLTMRPELGEHDFATIRQLYSEAQLWTRHYEMLIINANVMLISASLIFVGIAFTDRVGPRKTALILSAPVLMALVGMVLTRTLFGPYGGCLRRLIRLENLLNCYDETKLSGLDDNGSMLETSLMSLPVALPMSARFFVGLYMLLMIIYLALIAAKWSE
jgi:hypothetical protein